MIFFKVIKTNEFDRVFKYSVSKEISKETFLQYASISRKNT